MSSLTTATYSISKDLRLLFKLQQHLLPTVISTQQVLHRNKITSIINMLILANIKDNIKRFFGSVKNNPEYCLILKNREDTSFMGSKKIFLIKTKTNYDVTNQILKDFLRRKVGK